jgi:hypothetical protein
LLQTFPKDYDFGEEIKTVEVSRHIGNAVPPELGLVIGFSASASHEFEIASPITVIKLRYKFLPK